MDGREPLLVEGASGEGGRQRPPLPLHDGGLDDPTRPPGVLLEDRRQRELEDDRHGRDAGGGCPPQERPSGRTGHVRGVDDRQPSRGKPSLDDPVEDGEGRPTDGLVGFVAADEAAELVGGDDLVGGELAGSSVPGRGGNCGGASLRSGHRLGFQQISSDSWEDRRRWPQTG
jgi:hypothetical protein